MSDRMLRIRCSNADFERWVQQSKESGFRNLSEWIRRRLNAESPVGIQSLPVATQVLPVQELYVQAQDREFRRDVLDASGVSPYDRGQDSVQEIVFEKPATWRLVTHGGLRTSVAKKPDPSSKKWAKQDLMTFCVENDVLGFQKAWDDLESRLSGDGEFSL